MEPIIIFGTDHSLETQQIFSFLDEYGIAAEYLNLDTNELAEAWLLEECEAVVNPTVRLTDGRLLLNPPLSVLAQEFGINLLPDTKPLSPNVPPTLLFGTEWSRETWQIRQLFKHAQIDFEYLDIEKDVETLQRARDQAQGAFLIPIVILPNEEILVGPTLREIADIFGIDPKKERLRSGTRPLGSLDDDLPRDSNSSASAGR